MGKITKKELEASLSQEITQHTEDYAAHILSHAPADAQKNSDVTKSEIEAKLTGTISSHSHFDSYLDYVTTQDTVSIYKSGLDSNNIYTVIDYKKTGAIMVMKSTLSGGTSPCYTTLTEQHYDNAGSAVVKTIVYTLTYDVNNIPISIVSSQS